MANRVGYGVPRSTWEIERPALRDIVLRNPHQLVLVSAPAGCGKSVLVSQVCDQESDALTLWLDCSRLKCDRRSLSERVLAALLGWESAQDESTLLPSASPEELEAELTRALSSLETGVYIVLDDLQLEDGISTFISILQLVRDYAPTGSKLIVTTRARPLAAYPIAPAEMLRIDAAALSMNGDEIERMLDSFAPDASQPQSASEIAELSGGHAALAAVLARRLALAGPSLPLKSEEDTSDLLTYLARDQLSARGMRLLYVVALLRTGRIPDVLAITPEMAPEDLREIEVNIPLFRLERGPAQCARFSLHDLACEVFTDPGFLAACLPDWRDLREKVLKHLELSGDYAEALRLLLESDTGEKLLQLLERRGNDLLGSADAMLLEQALSYVGPEAYVRHPRLLLLQARHLRSTADFREALAKASVAKDLARCDGDCTTEHESELLRARLLIDLGQFSQATESLRAALAIDDVEAAPATRCLTHLYLGVCLAFTGNTVAALQHAHAAVEYLKVGRFRPETMARVALAMAGIRGLIGGRWDLVLADYDALLDAGRLSIGLQAEVDGNRAMVLAELGRLDRAESLVSQLLESCKRYGLCMNERSLLGTLSVIAGGLGEYRRAADMAEEAVSKGRDASDRIEVTATLTYHSATLRAQGLLDRALIAAEEALEFCGPAGALGFLSWLAILETAASLLALGDVDAARTRSTKVREEAAASQALYHTLRADLILAEIETRDGLIEDAVARLRAHEEYILTESSNWQIAMYIRSFPSLLGILGTAIDPDMLPAHLLQMVLPQDAEETLRASSAVMEPDAWRRLAVRIVGEAMAAQIAGEPTAPPCRVQLFGGLDVQVGERHIAEKEWRKRKARLIFAMLVLRQGRDVPREQLMEHLWPEMEEPRARNNFYVVWSAMKGALSPEAGRGEPCPYVENTGGLCRAVRSLVHSDVDDFDRTLQRARDADSGGDSAAAVRHYERLAEVYRGDLMPGDLYDDWFAAARDRYRNEFSDAMMRAAEILQHAQDPAHALRLVRSALLFDPWREDLYQTALQCQIATGQRSAAIDTYMSCRSRLADDLGIDPSSETTRLYEHVLAMEDRASGETRLS